MIKLIHLFISSVAYLHSPEEWCGTHFVPRCTLMSSTCITSSCDCRARHSWPITVVSVDGSQHDIMASFCGCKSKPEILVENGLWPSSPVNPTIAFDIRYVELARLLLLEADVSLQKFCSVMSLFSRGKQRTFSEVRSC